MILIFSAPSGAGKSTLINFLLTQRRDLEFSISATTPRPDRSNHVKTEAEAANQIAFGIRFGKQKHQLAVIRKFKNQLEIEFI